MVKVCAQLSKWQWLSYRERFLDVNNLAASTLWHKLKLLSPPRNVVVDIQKQLVNVLWLRQHWIQAAAPSLPVEESRQALVDFN